MSNTAKHDWIWAFRKMRKMRCSPVSALYRAILYAIRGDTGRFVCREAHMKIRIRR